MGFPTVKSDPWRKDRPLNRRHRLWPESFWRRLVEEAKWHCSEPGVPEACVRMIGDMNELLYGRR